jgi:hypothetical protein
VDEKAFKARVARLEEVGKVLEKLPAEVRASAFELLKGYVGAEAATPPGKRPAGKPTPAAADDSADGEEEAFFSQFEHDKPFENVRLIAAYYYREYGSAPFSLDEVRQKAIDVGLTIPDRVDMTILQAKDKGKQLFARAGHGKFRPTVHGETYLKATYKVGKGKKPRPKAAE